MRKDVLACMVLTVVTLGTPARAAARCGDAAGDAAAVAAARAAVANGCACDTSSRKTYVSCVVQLVRTRVHDGQLSRSCGHSVKSCARRSTCGRPGTVACCRVSYSGAPKCRITRPDKCLSKGGCLGNYASCCDACGPTGCVPTTTTSTSTTTTSSTTTPAQGTCGNGVIESGEQCDGGEVCESNCYLRRFACCEYGAGATACSASVIPFTLISQRYTVCGQYGGTFRNGMLQASTDACPNPPSGAPPTYAGACAAPPALAAPVTFCCQNPSPSCNEVTTADHTALLDAEWNCAINNYPNRPGMLGTCGVDGVCVPAH